MNPEQLRVCVVSPLYHPNLGGVGRQAMLLTERLAEMGVKTVVIARRMKGMPPAQYSARVPVYRAWTLRPYLHTFEDISVINILVSLSFCLGCAILLLRKRKEYDIVHFHGASLPLFFNFPVAKLLGKKVIAKVAGMMGTEPGTLRGRHHGLGNIFIRLLQGMDMFVATTSAIVEGLKDDGFDEKHIRRIPNFIDMNRYESPTVFDKGRLRSSLGLTDGPIVIYAGRFISCKGIDSLLDAWQEVSKQFPEARLLLLGEGLLFEKMQQKAKDLGIERHTEFRGHVDNIDDYLHAGDIFVLSSLHEGMPNSLLEAMACGLAPVATAIGGVADIIQNSVNGIIVPPGNAREMAAGISTLLNDEKLCSNIGRNAYATIRGSYSLDSVVAQYAGLYQQLYKENGYIS